MSPNRLEAFSDGVFAIAITLLVLDISVPSPDSAGSLGEELAAQWPSYAAYVVSFLTIGIIWINHHAMFRRLRAVDERRRRQILVRGVSGTVPYLIATALAAITPYVTLAICAAVAVFYAMPFASATEPASPGHAPGRP